MKSISPGMSRVAEMIKKKTSGSKNDEASDKKMMKNKKMLRMK